MLLPATDRDIHSLTLLEHLAEGWLLRDDRSIGAIGELGRLSAELQAQLGERRRGSLGCEPIEVRNLHPFATATTEDEYLAVVRAKTAALFAAACEVGPIIAGHGKAEISACRSYGTNLGIAFQLIDDALDYGGSSAKLGKNVGDDFREGKITLPVVLAFRRGNDAERAFWKEALEAGDASDTHLDKAMGLMTKHRSIEDTIERARHYGAMAHDALELFPQTPMKAALVEAIDFCISRAH